MPSTPFVTVVLSCCDDEPDVATAIRAVLEQDWPRDRLELLVADGMSLDATREIVARLADEDDRIRLVDNPARTRAAGLNECIRRARGAIIVRVDARGSYDAGFVRACVEALDRTGADDVGGQATPEGSSFFQRCVAAALRSPLAGGSPAARGDAYRRAIFERAGLFDPNAGADDGAELALRVEGAGGRVAKSPEVALRYRVRDSARSLARRCFEEGQGRARTLLKHRQVTARGPALPFLLLAGEAAVLVTSRWHKLARWTLGGYALATGAEAVRVGSREGALAVPVVWALFPAVHAARGAGFAAGLVRYVVKPDWQDAERLEHPVEPVDAVAVG
jgi:glycosyltransferase involved in cell wall biosynthesis